MSNWASYKKEIFLKDGVALKSWQLLQGLVLALQVFFFFFFLPAWGLLLHLPDGSQSQNTFSEREYKLHYHNHKPTSIKKKKFKLQIMPIIITSITITSCERYWRDLNISTLYTRATVHIFGLWITSGFSFKKRESPGLWGLEQEFPWNQIS